MFVRVFEIRLDRVFKSWEGTLILGPESSAFGLLRRNEMLPGTFEGAAYGKICWQIA